MKKKILFTVFGLLAIVAIVYAALQLPWGISKPCFVFCMVISGMVIGFIFSMIKKMLKAYNAVLLCYTSIYSCFIAFGIGYYWQLLQMQLYIALAGSLVIAVMSLKVDRLWTR